MAAGLSGGGTDPTPLTNTYLRSGSVTSLFLGMIRSDDRYARSRGSWLMVV